MIRDITLGQFYKTDSLVHRLDPRTKLFATMMFFVCLFVTRELPYFGILGICLLIAIGLSKVPLSYMLRGLKPMWVLLAFTAVMNLMTQDGEVVFDWWIVKVTDRGIENAILILVRMVYMVLGSGLLTYTTRPTDLAYGLEKGLHWLKIFKVPVHEMAMMISIALRFIPILVEELNRIMNAQIARGACLDDGKLMERVKATIPIIVPLFVSAVGKADAMALAMEARCYHGGDGRTRMHELKRGIWDLLVYVIIWALLGLGIVFAFWLKFQI